MIKKLRSHGLPVFITLLFFGCSQDEVCIDADLVLLNTKVYTANPSQPEADALAIKGDKFIFIGSNS